MQGKREKEKEKEIERERERETSRKEEKGQAKSALTQQHSSESICWT